MQFLALVLLCIVFAVLYGIVHDQVTARVCVEYFTIGHPPVFGTDDPTLLGLGWGVLATWWVGLFMGLPLAVAARVGKHAKFSAAALIRPLAVLAATAGLCALAAGIAGWVLAQRGALMLGGYLDDAIPKERHALFIADLWAHNASYLIGFFGGLVLIAWVWWRRGILSRIPSPNTSSSPKPGM